jgi:hypothetical protein
MKISSNNSIIPEDGLNKSAELMNIWKKQTKSFIINKSTIHNIFFKPIQISTGTLNKFLAGSFDPANPKGAGNLVTTVSIPLEF